MYYAISTRKYYKIDKFIGYMSTIVRFMTKKHTLYILQYNNIHSYILDMLVNIDIYM